MILNAPHGNPSRSKHKSIAWQLHEVQKANDGDEADDGGVAGYPLIEGKHSLASVLPRELFDELHALTPPAKRFGLRDMLKPALADPSSKVGCVAGSAAYYDTYRKLFDPLVAQLHPGSDSWIGTPPAPPSDSHSLDLPQKWLRMLNGSSISKVRFRSTRSIDGFPFLPACGPRDMADVASLLERTIRSMTQGDAPHPICDCHVIAM